MTIQIKVWHWTVLALVLTAAAATLAVRLATLGRADGGVAEVARVDAGTETSAAGEAFRWTVPDKGVWKMFRTGEQRPLGPGSGALSARWRLAGIFVLLGDAGGGNNRRDARRRCAILDDLQAKKQYLLEEGARMEDIRVVRVEQDRVTLSDGLLEEELTIAAGTLGSAGAGDGGRMETGATGPAEVLETNRFGNRVGETRWEFSREAVLAYYQEMMENPERAAGLFNAMESSRDEAGKIDGYRLNTASGEADFYTQVGLKNGDVVRRVNSLRMTSRKRAEYFIREFARGQLGAVVLDIERDGQPQKLVYLVQ